MGCGASTQTPESCGADVSVQPRLKAVDVPCNAPQNEILSRRSVMQRPEPEPEPEQRGPPRPFPPPQLDPEHRAFVTDTICWQRYYLTDDPSQRPRSGSELHFCLMEPWQQGFLKLRSSRQKHGDNSTATVATANYTVAPSKRNVLSEWLAGIVGLEHKAPLVEEQLFIQLWTQGLPLSVGGVPVDLEALCGERSLAYLHRLASRFDAHDVVRFFVLLHLFCGYVCFATPRRTDHSQCRRILGRNWQIFRKKRQRSSRESSTGYA